MKNSVKKLSIGIVCSPWLGGSGVVGSELAQYLAKTNKYQVVFIGVDFPFRMNKHNIMFHKVSNVKHALFSSPLNEASLTEGIVEAVILHKLDLIHAHFAIPFAYCALQAREILKQKGIDIKVVTTLHGTDVLSLGQEVPQIMKYVLEESDRVTAVSNDLAKRAKQIYACKKQIEVIYNFINFSTFPQKAIRPQLKKKYASSNEKVFVHISNFRPIKRIGDCIKIFSKVNKKMPAVLLLIGEGPEIENIKKQKETVRNQDSIHFVGRVKNPYSFLEIADGLIITSEYESFCLVGLEALAYGVPVFSTNVGGISEVITHDRLGYLADVGDIDGLASHILTHFVDEEKIHSFTKEAYKASHEFTAEKIIPGYEAVYHQVVGTNK